MPPVVALILMLTVVLFAAFVVAALLHAWDVISWCMYDILAAVFGGGMVLVWIVGFGGIAIVNLWPYVFH